MRESKGRSTFLVNVTNPGLFPTLPAIRPLLLGVLFTVAIFGVGRADPAASEVPNRPNVFLLDAKLLAQAKEAVAQDDPIPSAALANLLREAEAALTAGPFSVVDKTLVPPSGDKHDYMSLGLYWWPNPNTPDGLPYIRRDGRANPETQNDQSDRRRLGAMTRAVDALALAYYFTGDQRYAARAAFLLRTWFLDTDTRMNPHLQYGQAIPGRVEGRGIGIIDTVCLLKVVDAAGLIEASDAWTEDDHRSLRAWFADYLEWLQTSQYGIDESRTKNNHGTWYDAQVASFALFVGDRETAESTLRSAGRKRLVPQIDSDGRQPEELARTRSFNYSVMNLVGMFSLARLGEHVGVDLWHYPDEGKPLLESALDYLTPYADPNADWPHEQITEFRRTGLLPLLRQGLLVYQKPRYLKQIRLFSPKQRQHGSVLRYPVP